MLKANTWFGLLGGGIETIEDLVTKTPERLHEMKWTFSTYHLNNIEKLAIADALIQLRPDLYTEWVTNLKN